MHHPQHERNTEVRRLFLALRGCCVRITPCIMCLRAQREALPVFDFREEFLEAVEANQVVICVGETGSGALLRHCV